MSNTDEISQETQSAINNAQAEQIARRDIVTRQIDDYEHKLEALKSELQQADMIVQKVQGGNTAMQRFWETMSVPPASSIGRQPVGYESDTEHDDVDSLTSGSIASVPA
jgi:hypothetical protein